MARKIAVIGGSGSGKTTLAKELARRLGVPHVELDALFWGPNWAETPTDEFARRVTAATESDAWVADGNYMGRLGTLVLDRADLVVWLDLPLAVKLRRLLARTARRVRGDARIWNDNRETWRNTLVGRDALFPFEIRSHFQRKKTWPPRMEGRNVVRVRSSRQLRRWLVTLPAARE